MERQGAFSVEIQTDIETISGIEAIQKILEVVTTITGMGFSAVARVTSDKWIACKTNDLIGFGLSAGGELKLDTTICNEIRQHHKIVAIDHVAEDPLYYDHHTPKLYGLQSYISVPIILRNGDFFGTLCAIDPNPAKVNNKQIIDMFTLFADLIAFHLDAHNKITESEQLLLEEQKNAETREQFIAMLGHDLRNPVNAISNSVQLQLRSKMDERNTRLATIIKDATIRTIGLIDNILDFASGRLGGGINLSFEHQKPLEDTLSEVITELSIAWPDKNIHTRFELRHEVRTDHRRMAQLFSNLLGNAITHGTGHTPIQVSAVTTPEGLELCVINGGKGIPEQEKQDLFKPFSRGKHRPGQEGLGLGLYISSEIAKAHKGTISVESDEEKTCFRVIIPA